MKRRRYWPLLLVIIVSALLLGGCDLFSETITYTETVVLYEFTDEYKAGTPITKDMLKEVQVELPMTSFMTGDGRTYTAEVMSQIVVVTRDNYDYYMPEGTILKQNVPKGYLLRTDSIDTPKYYAYAYDYPAGTKLSDVELITVPFHNVKTAEHLYNGWTYTDYLKFISTSNKPYGWEVEMSLYHLATPVKALQVVKWEHLQAVDGMDNLFKPQG